MWRWRCFCGDWGILERDDGGEWKVCALGDGSAVRIEAGAIVEA